MATKQTDDQQTDDQVSMCPVTRGEVDLDHYAEFDRVWRGLKVAAPARRALVDAGILSMEDLRGADFEQLKALHGMGPGALRTLRRALDE